MSTSSEKHMYTCMYMQYTVYCTSHCDDHYMYSSFFLLSIPLFSSSIRPFLGGENDFCHCLNEMFPRLKTRNLSIMQWRIIRRMIGKPRRCSSTFFAEERTVLTEKRRRLRELQRKVHQGTVSLTSQSSVQFLVEPPLLSCMYTQLSIGTYMYLFTCKQGSSIPTQLQKSTYKGFLKLFPVRFEILVINTFEVKKLNIHFNWAPGSPCVYETQALMQNHYIPCINRDLIQKNHTCGA